jgi:hypothetical protein
MKNRRANNLQEGSNMEMYSSHTGHSGAQSPHSFASNYFPSDSADRLVWRGTILLWLLSGIDLFPKFVLTPFIVTYFIFLTLNMIADRLPEG